MSTLTSYYYDGSKFSKLLDEKFPKSMGIDSSVDFSLCSRQSIDEIMDSLKETLANPFMKQVEVLDSVRENITCLPDKVKDKIVSLFDDDNLLLYGHGGNADEILREGKMRCKYANISSHFIPLSQTNSSLDNLNHWPHRDAKKILIMGIDRREFNPIYRREDNGYSIPSEYFLGYYDKDLEEFIVNPLFKKRHEYREEDPSIELHTGEYHARSLYSDQENFQHILDNLTNINMILNLSSYLPLDQKGITGVAGQVLHLVKDTYEEVEKITPEAVSAYNSTKTTNNNDRVSDNSIFTDEDWTFDFDDGELNMMFSDSNRLNPSTKDKENKSI